MKWIKFQGNKYLLVGGDTIATEHQYKNGLKSYAVIWGDKVIRYGEEIGTRKQIEVLGDADDVEPNPGAWSNLLNGFLLGG